MTTKSVETEAAVENADKAKEEEEDGGGRVGDASVDRVVCNAAVARWAVWRRPDDEAATAEDADSESKPAGGDRSGMADVSRNSVDSGRWVVAGLRSANEEEEEEEEEASADEDDAGAAVANCAFANPRKEADAISIDGGRVW